MLPAVLGGMAMFCCSTHHQSANTVAMPRRCACHAAVQRTQHVQIFPNLKAKLRNFTQRLAEAGGVEGLLELDEELGLEEGINPIWRVPDRVIAEETDADGAPSRLCASCCACIREHSGSATSSTSAWVCASTAEARQVRPERKARKPEEGKSRLVRHSRQCVDPSRSGGGPRQAPECGRAGTETFLFKWKGLEYEDCTWEEASDVAANDFEEHVAAFRALKPIAEQAAELKEADKEAAQARRSQARDGRTYTETPPFLQVRTPATSWVGAPRTAARKVGGRRQSELGAAYTPAGSHGEIGRCGQWQQQRRGCRCSSKAGAVGAGRGAAPVPAGRPQLAAPAEPAEAQHDPRG